MQRFYTVQTPTAKGQWQQCGNSRYMNAEEAMAVYRECAEHIAVAVFESNPGKDGLKFEIRRNF